MSRITIINFENGKHDISFTRGVKISEILEININNWLTQQKEIKDDKTIG